MKLEKKKITVDGIPYVYYEGGAPSKPVLLLLHGFTANKDVWSWFAQAFLGDFRILIPDMAGHGETGFDSQLAYDIPAQAVRMLHFARAVGVENFHVAGNSMGGYIAAVLALNYPSQVLSVIAVDPAGVHSPEKSNLERSIQNGKNPFEVCSDDEFRIFHAMTMAKPPNIPEPVMQAMSEYYQASRDELMLIFSQFTASDKLESRLPDIKQPMLLIWGALDELIHVSAVQVWSSGVPHAQVFVFDDLGHMPMLEDAERTARVVKTFFEQHQFSPEAS